MCGGVEVYVYFYNLSNTIYSYFVHIQVRIPLISVI